MLFFLPVKNKNGHRWLQSDQGLEKRCLKIAYVLSTTFVAALVVNLRLLSGRETGIVEVEAFYIELAKVRLYILLDELDFDHINNLMMCLLEANQVQKRKNGPHQDLLNVRVLAQDCLFV